MTIQTHVAEAVIVALAIFAHAWQGRIHGDPRILSVIGWVVNILTVLVLAACWVDC